MPIVSVTQFDDVVDFLWAYAQTARKINPRWSYGIWARQLGVKDPSSITKLLKGERNPGRSLTEKFVRFFAFTPREAEHFRDLVKLRKLKTEPRLHALLAGEVRQRTQLSRRERETQDRSDPVSDHLISIEMAREAITWVPLEQMEFVSTAFLLDRKNLFRARQLIGEFKHRFIRLLNRNQGQQMFRLQIQFFPVLGHIDQDSLASAPLKEGTPPYGLDVPKGK